MNNTQTIKPVVLRIQRDFRTLIKHKPLYHIMIRPKKVAHVKDLQFRAGKHLKKLINTYPVETFKFLFVIEYSTNISIGNSEIEAGLGEHVHILIHTDLGNDDVFNLENSAEEKLKTFLSTTWGSPVHIYTERIDNRTDLSLFDGYLIKQAKNLTGDNYHSNI